MKKSSIIIGILSLSGCASIDYEPIVLDSPISPLTAGLPVCPKGLDEGDKTCMAWVQANKPASPTGIQVTMNDAYCLDVPPHQAWFDKDRRNTPPDGEEGSWIMRRFPKRKENAGFFSLMINVKPVSGQVMAEENAEMVSSFVGRPFRPKEAGELMLYPNDALGPTSDPWYWYGNNAGQIWVKIKRCL